MGIETILLGAAAGVTYGLTVYSKKENVEFDYKKFGTTVALGALAGVIHTVANYPVDAAFEFGISIGAITIIENASKAIYRKVIKPLMDKWNSRYT